MCYRKVPTPDVPATLVATPLFLRANAENSPRCSSSNSSSDLPLSLLMPRQTSGDRLCSMQKSSAHVKEVRYFIVTFSPAQFFCVVRTVRSAAVPLDGLGESPLLAAPGLPFYSTLMAEGRTPPNCRCRLEGYCRTGYSGLSMLYGLVLLYSWTVGYCICS